MITSRESDRFRDDSIVITVHGIKVIHEKRHTGTPIKSSSTAKTLDETNSRGSFRNKCALLASLPCTWISMRNSLGYGGGGGW